ncbi:Ankyrin repeat-containing domain protein [Apiospora arundinis]|uniref:Ankyrin repeat-containing domain protein n=1 Tax=Apiospora arundinis TaxID=335852 RepID=A0ABR2IWA3_9PEZI
MASSTANILKEDWEKHKAIIMQLYSERGLPLIRRNDAEKDQCVDWIMRNQHGFSASKWQYENQLKKWGIAKNLKQDEWVSLLSHHDLLETQGKEVRIVISGKVQTKERIRKARHRYCGSPAARLHRSPQGTTPAPSRQAFVEIKVAGSWRLCNPDELSETSITMVPSLGAPQYSSERSQTTAREESTVASSPQPRMVPPRIMDVSQSLFPGPSPINLPLDETNFFCESLPSPSFDPHILDFGSFQLDTGQISPLGAEIDFFGPINSPSHHLIHEFQPKSTRHRSCDNQEPSGTALRPVQRSLLIPEQFFRFLSRLESDETVVHDAVLLRAINITKDRFQSLVSAESDFWQDHNSSQTVGSVLGFENEHLNTLLYSMINGFASLDDIPRGSILQMLSGHEGLSQHLINLLKIGPDSMAKQLADNLFRAAVISSDARAVAILLETIQTRPSIAIDLNSFTFKYGSAGGTQPPLALALEFGNEELVKTLLKDGATPNWPLHGSRVDIYCPLASLEVAVKGNFSDISAKARVVVLLIQHGAEITDTVIYQAIHRAAVELAVFKAVMEGITADKHTITFDGIIQNIARYVENSVAFPTVQRLVGACLSTDCGQCVLDADTMNETLAHAARRGNTELVEVIAPYATTPSDALAGAVRSGKMQLVRFLIGRGARADGLPVEIDGEEQDTTPLAEAIRLQDSDFVDILTEYGAWRLVGERGHFEPAIAAAAQVGNLRYLETIIDRAEPPVRHYLFEATFKAIENDKTEVVLALLKAGATNLNGLGHLSYTPFLTALKNRNKPIVLALLDTNWGHVIWGNGAYGTGLAMELACEWGDMDVIEVLSSMDFELDIGCNSTPLGAAVKLGHNHVVEYLLQIGANPGAKDQFGGTALSAAVKNRDYEMMDYLLSKGATPADILAFGAAQKLDDLTSFSKLRSAFLAMHPSGSKGFGGELLLEAIHANKQHNIDAFVSMKVDMDSIIDWWSYKSSILQDFGQERDKLAESLADVPRGMISPMGFAIMHSKVQDSLLVSQLLLSGAQADVIAFRDLYWHSQTPLLLGIEAGSKEIVEMLLDKGASINRSACRGIIRTPLQKASEMGGYDMVEFLLQKGADVSSPPAKQDGGTALQLAAKSGSMKICELLLDNGADPHAPAPEFGGGHNSFEWAAEMGRYHILLLLWKVAPRDGFTMELVQRARDIAQRNGHRGCVDVITTMLHEVSSGRLIS